MDIGGGPAAAYQMQDRLTWWRQVWN